MQTKKMTGIIGRLALFIMVVCPFTALAQSGAVNIVFIGNSITEGTALANYSTDAPPVKAVEWLKENMPGYEINFSNQGVSGATTVDFLPATERLMKRVEEAADRFAQEGSAQLLFTVSLGTNDSAIEGPNGSPVSTADYRKNIKAITDHLLARYPGCIIIFQHPIWYSPNTHNGTPYLAEGQARLQTYFKELDLHVRDYRSSYPNQIFTGYTDGFKYFSKHPELFVREEGRTGVFQLHPNEQGSKELGIFWARSIQKVLKKTARR
ncbi:MAG TPA: GDSL-type esterase/lipase family protein [Flavihumibacter sp.]|jgi:lysophospholipase L1-like esterase